jgi:hypothetical protein
MGVPAQNFSLWALRFARSGEENHRAAKTSFGCRYSRDRSFSVLGLNRAFVLVMAAGSIVGAFIGGLLLRVVPDAVLLPALAAILVISAIKVWRHR